MQELFHALPAPGFQKNVSLLDALPDPKLSTTLIDFESKPSLLSSNVAAMSAAAEFAVLTHRKALAEDENGGAKVVKKSTARKRGKAGADALPKKKQEKRSRGRELKTRVRGNQRA